MRPRAGCVPPEPTERSPFRMSRRVIVTRPAQEAQRWIDALGAKGLTAVALPLIAIEAVADRRVLDVARQQVAGRQALMFVSASAVSHFVDAGVVAALSVESAPRCWATGPGTVRALHDAGVPGSMIDAPPADAPLFDSEALWMVVRAQVVHGTRVLIVRGGDPAGRPSGRDWLAREIESAGGVVSAVASYRRTAPRFGAAELALAAAAANDGSVWIFSSSEGVGNLCLAMPGADWRSALAVATHPRIAEAARTAGFGRVSLVRPGVADLVASIESFE